MEMFYGITYMRMRPVSQDYVDAYRITSSHLNEDRNLSYQEIWTHRCPRRAIMRDQHQMLDLFALLYLRQANELISECQDQGRDLIIKIVKDFYFRK